MIRAESHRINKTCSRQVWKSGAVPEIVRADCIFRVENPNLLHRMMAILRDGTLALLESLEEQGLLGFNNDGSYIGSGALGWSDELPQPDFDGKVRICDMWGLAESQETVGVSPDMFAEFILPYQLPIIERFGLSCYGCCEPDATFYRWY